MRLKRRVSPAAEGSRYAGQTDGGTLMTKDRNDRDRQEALDEYRNLISLYIHEDNFMLKVLQLFILLNTLLAGLAKFSPETPLLNVILALLGMASCLAWHLMGMSASKHHDLRAFRARQIEYDLGWKGTFHDEIAVFHYSNVDLPKFYDSYKPHAPQPAKRYRRMRASLVMSCLVPVLVGSAWFGYLLSSLPALWKLGHLSG